ncbi:MAG: XdhC family protein [Gemmatimonadales bacterium]
MRADLIQLASDLTERNVPFALVTVVRREAPSSARVGDTALITEGGTFHGWLGGSCTQPTAVREALAALASGAPRLVALDSDPEPDPRPGVTILPMTCHSGGNVDLYVEPVLPKPRLFLFGMSPIARALARLAHVLGYAVEAIDPLADQASFPHADRVVTDFGSPEPVQRARQHRGRSYAVVATLGDSDVDAIGAAVLLEPDYLGLVASRKRFASLTNALTASGLSQEQIDAIDNPAGLNLGAITPAEVALSILAEIIRRREETLESAPAAATAAEETDPVCGMSVTTMGAGHVEAYEGRTFYFCGAGCRDKFRAEPERFLAESLAGDNE